MNYLLYPSIFFVSLYRVILWVIFITFIIIIFIASSKDIFDLLVLSISPPDESFDDLLFDH